MNESDSTKRLLIAMNEQMIEFTASYESLCIALIEKGIITEEEVLESKEKWYNMNPSSKKMRDSLIKQLLEEENK